MTGLSGQKLLKRNLFWIAMMMTIALQVFADSRPAWFGMRVAPLWQGSTGSPMVALLIRNINARGPAERAGLRAGDLIVALDAKAVGFKNERAMMEYFSAVRPAQRLRIAAIRGQKRIELVLLPHEMDDEQYELWRKEMSRATTASK